MAASAVEAAARRRRARVLPGAVGHGLPARGPRTAARVRARQPGGVGRARGEDGDACPVIAGFVDRSDRGSTTRPRSSPEARSAPATTRSCCRTSGCSTSSATSCPASGPSRSPVGGLSVGLSVCEDAWHPGRPFSDYRGVPLVSNINGSPYHRRKLEERLGVLRDRAREFGGWIAYVNAVGGQDELVFDGGSVVMGPDGEVACRAALFDEDLLIVDVDDTAARAEHDAVWPEPRRRSTGPSCSACATTSGRTASTTWSSACREGSTQHSWPCSRPMRSGRMPSARSRCRRRTRAPESLEDAADVASRLGIRLDTSQIDDVFGAYRTTLRRCSRAAPRTSPRRTCRRGSAGTC